MLELTAINYQELAAQAQARGEQTRQTLALGFRNNLPQQLGKGGDRILHLRNGLTICIRKGVLSQSIRKINLHESKFPLIAKFYLSGMSRVETPDASDVDSDYAEIAGHHYLYHLPNQTEREEWPANQLIHLVMVTVDPNYFSSFTSDQAGLPSPLQKLVEGNITQRFHQPLGQMTPRIRQLVQSILECPYSGLMQQMYLEGKALELLAAQFMTWIDQPTMTPAVVLSAADVSQLHRAKEILIERSQQPPSLNELARLVGLNDRKLNQGFRHLFGTTVFGYLQTHRLQQAKVLLQDDYLSVSAVAISVGYRNPEAFSTAFRRKFSVSPKTYQLSWRGS